MQFGWIREWMTPRSLWTMDAPALLRHLKAHTHVEGEFNWDFGFTDHFSSGLSLCCAPSQNTILRTPYYLHVLLLLFSSFPQKFKIVALQKETFHLLESLTFCSKKMAYVCLPQWQFLNWLAFICLINGLTVVRWACRTLCNVCALLDLTLAYWSSGLLHYP